MRGLRLALVVVLAQAAALAPDLAAAAPQQEVALAEWRVRLEADRAAEREAAAAGLRRALRVEDLDAALVALEEWPPTPALHLRGIVIDLPLLRAPLLERSLREPADRAAALAHELLVEAFRARADGQAPFLDEIDTARTARLPWSQHGLFVERSGAPCAPIAWRELRRALADVRAWSQPIVLLPGAGGEGGLAIPAPRAARAPAEGWLEIELSRQALVPVRRAVATWVVPAELARPEPELSGARRGGELALLLEHEARLLSLALRRLAGLPPFEQGRGGGDLLALLGMPCVALAQRDDPFARGIAEALASHRIGDAPAAAPNGSTPESSAPSDEGDGEAVDPRAALRLAIENIEGGQLDAESGRAALRDVVDRLPDRLEREPLLGGELAELLRSRSALPAPDPAATALFAQAEHELFLLGRSSRPGTALVVLPAGSASRPPPR